MEELDSLLQVIGSPAYFFDMASHKLLCVNQPFADLLEYAPEDLIGMSLGELRPAEELAKMARALLKSPPEGNVEWRYKTRTGKILYVRLSYRNSIYFDKTTKHRHDVRLVVISGLDTQMLKPSEDLFG